MLVSNKNKQSHSTINQNSRLSKVSHSTWQATLTTLLALFSLQVFAQTVITVEDTRDLVTSNAPNRDTCNFTVGGGAITRAAPDGICTFRRAINEATARPNADRPITIEFNIPTSDSNYDATLDIWEVQINQSFALELDRINTLETRGEVTIDGDSQPRGRSDGPKIMINTNRDNLETFGRSLEVRTPDNNFRNLGFHGGGQIILFNSGNVVENIWMGLSNDGLSLELASDASEQATRSLARGGIIMPNSASDNNRILNNRIIGATERAIRVTSGGSGNEIRGNFIGMTADGNITTPSSGLQCLRAPNLLNGVWYGGQGIQVTGSNNVIEDNILAGLHVTQTTNQTPAVSLEIAGTNNTITNNQVGVTENAELVGVCGQGLLLQGTASTVTGNSFFGTRVGFDPGDAGTELDAAIITQSFNFGGGQSLEVRENLIMGLDQDSDNVHAYRFGASVPEELRRFVPAQITEFNGVNIEGSNGEPLLLGPPTDCPGCTIYIYLDDDDDRIESLTTTAFAIATADSDGNWSAVLPRELEDGESLRTQSQTNAPNVIGNFAAGTTSRLSDVAYQPEEEELCIPIRARNGNIALVCL